MNKLNLNQIINKRQKKNIKVIFIDTVSGTRLKVR